MSTTELREVAQRILQWMGETPPEEPYDMPIDAETLAMAVMDETDPTPLTEAWLRSVGFGKPNVNGYPLLIPCASGDPVELWLDHDWWMSLLQSNRDDHVTITSARYKTRGDVRRLCQALGINLTESR